MDYKKLLIQQYHMNGLAVVNHAAAIDTQATYNVVCQECPFKMLPESNELPKREWFDQDGEDVYIPTDGLKFKAYDMEVKFIYEGTGYKKNQTVVSKEAEMKEKVTGFIDFLYGRNTDGYPQLKIYDEYTLTGRQGIYVLSVDNEMLAYDDRNNNVIGVFKVKFRVTDPVTRMTYSNGNIVKEQ